MKGDFTRNTFDPLKHFSRVLMQQGRVQLDADWNEQGAILLHYLHRLMTDLIGPQAGPVNYCGFEIVNFSALKTAEQQRLKALGRAPASGDFLIGPGRYYVDGILCENDDYFPYLKQPDPPAVKSLQNGITYLVYLNVWERHITHVEDDSIREVALGGPDTTTRAKVVWQVKVLPSVVDYCADTEKLLQLSTARLRARAKLDQMATDPCVIQPEARYRGAENQLYRVEIHTGNDAGKQPTFKWSRENGSVVFPILNIASDGTAKTTTVKLVHLGRDDKLSLAEGDWVEIVDDDYVLQNRAEPLLQVHSMDRVEMTVTLTNPTGTVSGVSGDPTKHPLLRRWDQKAGDPNKGGLQLSTDDYAALVVEDRGEASNHWLVLEDGVQIQFSTPAHDESAHEYRTGDYWLIPARTATGDVEWPKVDNPIADALSPHGVTHHYAPLAIITVNADRITEVKDCRCCFNLLPCASMTTSTEALASVAV